MALIKQFPAKPVLNRQHRLAKNLSRLWVVDNGVVRCLVSGLIGVKNGTVNDALLSYGKAKDFASGSGANYYALEGVPHLSGSSAFTVIAGIRLETTSSGTTNGYVIYCERAATGNDILKLTLGGTTGSNTKLGGVYRDDAGTLNRQEGTASLHDGLDHIVGWSQNGTVTNGTVFYLDGKVELTMSTTASATLTNANIVCRIGADPADPVNTFWPDYVSFVALWKNRALTNSEQRYAANYIADLMTPQWDRDTSFTAAAATTTPNLIGGNLIRPNLVRGRLAA